MDLKDILNEKNCLPAKVVSMVKVPMTTKSGFLSDIEFLTLILTNGEEMHLIMKTCLKSYEEKEEPRFYNMSQSMSVFELDFYENVYPELNHMMTELHLPCPLPRCHYAGVTEEGPVIILDDLTRCGLQMPSLTTDISENDLRSILWSLANVQTGACALQLRRKASLLELFPFLKKNAAGVFIEDLCKNNIEVCKQYFIKKHPDRPNLAELMSTIGLDADIIEHFYSANDTELCLSHGDLWNNNIFISNQECILIDWQCVSCGYSIGDIATLVVFGIDLGPNPSHRFESIVKIYLGFMVESCGDNAALKEFVKQRFVPSFLSAKMRKLSLQLMVKQLITCFKAFGTDSDTDTGMKNRLMNNMYNILLELSQ